MIGDTHTHTHTQLLSGYTAARPELRLPGGGQEGCAVSLCRHQQQRLHPTRLAFQWAHLRAGQSIPSGGGRPTKRRRDSPETRVRTVGLRLGDRVRGGPSPEHLRAETAPREDTRHRHRHGNDAEDGGTAKGPGAGAEGGSAHCAPQGQGKWRWGK